LSEDVYVYVSKKVLTPLAIQVLGTPHEALIVLKWMKYSTQYDDLYVDITLLTEGLTREQITMLRQTQDHAHEHYCCYLPGGTGNLGPVQPLISGYAKIITHSTTYGVERFEEGHFKQGMQD